VNTPAETPSGPEGGDQTPVSKSLDDLTARVGRITNPKPAKSRSELLATIASSLAAIVLAVLIGALILLLTGKSPSAAWDKVMSEGFRTVRLAEAVGRATPLIVAAVAVAIGFKMNLFNIGVEGQFLIGLFFAAIAGAYVQLPAVLHIAFILVVAMAAAALWAAIPAVLKVKRGVNEVIATIMLNSIALSVIDWLFQEKFRHPLPGNLDVKTKVLPSTAWLPTLFTAVSKEGKRVSRYEVTSFLLVALVVVILFWLLVYKSRFGFRLRASGANAVAARTAGISSNRMIVTAMLLSGAIAGLAGMPYLLSGDGHAYGPSRPDQYGFNGISVALLGRNHPAGIVAAALLWGWLDSLVGPLGLAKVPPSIVYVIKAIILLSVVILNEVVGRRVAKRTADRTAAQLEAVEVAAA